MLQVEMVIIDPQNDFMGNDDGSPFSVTLNDGTKEQASLPVPGAVSDMTRLAAMIDRIGPRLADIHVTLDSHRVIDVSHGGMWRDQNGNSPSPFTLIGPSEMDNGLWEPRHAEARPQALGGQTLREYFRDYVQKLADQGNYPLCIWPEHCLIGSWGHNVQTVLAAALQRWERSQFANVDYVVKGDDAYTEHYGALQAEVPRANSPRTMLNGGFLQTLAGADIIGVAGEASSHCVLETVKQIATHIGVEHVKKFHLLTDCMSPVIHPQIDFPAIAKAFFASMEAQGMTLTTSDKFLA